MLRFSCHSMYTNIIDIQPKVPEVVVSQKIPWYVNFRRFKQGPLQSTSFGGRITQYGSDILFRIYGREMLQYFSVPPQETQHTAFNINTFFGDEMHLSAL